MIPAAFRRATEPDPEAIARLERSFSGRSTRSRLALLPPPPRFVPSAARPRRDWRAPALAVCAVVLLCWVLAPRPAPQPLRARLEAEEPVTLALTSSLTLTYAGLGAAEASPDEIHIRWEVGELAMALEPGTRVRIETDEGTIRATEGALRVSRDARGTVLQVERGRATTDCAEATLEAGQSATCLPRRPAGLLARARGLRADRPAALAAVDRGLSICPADDPVRGELLALKAELLAPDDPAAAAAAARTYLAEGYQPRAEAMKSYLRGEP